MKILEKIEFLFGKLNHLLLKVGSLLSILLVSSMTGIILISVFFRYFLLNAIAWSEEVSKFLMVWMTLMAAPIALRYGIHVGVQSLVNALKVRYHNIAVLLGHLIILTLMGVCIKEGIELAWFARIQKASTLDLSLLWAYLPIPLGCMMMFTIAFEQFIVTLKKIFYPTDDHKSLGSIQSIQTPQG